MLQSKRERRILSLKNENIFTYSRYTWRATEGNPFVSATVKEKITREKAIAMMVNYLNKGHGNLMFEDINGQVISELSSRELGAPTSSEAWIERSPPLTEDEASELIKQIKAKQKEKK